MILVVGATGNVGSEVVRGLLAAGEEVRALTRHPGEAKLPAGVEVARGDLEDPESLAAAARGAEKVFLMARGPRMGAQVANFTRAAKDAAHVVFLSSLGAATESEAPIPRWHREAEKALRAGAFAWTILRPGAFASNALFAAESVRARGVFTTWFRPEARLATIDPIDIAAVAVTALTHLGHQGKIYTLTGEEPLTLLEQTDILAEVLGRKLVYETLPEQALLGMVQSIGAAHEKEAFLRQFREAGDGPESQPLPTVREVTGRPPRTFRQWALDHAGAFR